MTSIDDRDVTQATFAFPPLDLLQRTGYVGSSEPESAYDEIGRVIRKIIESMLPESWSWRGARVLDFGCGAGRVLRHFANETEHAEFWGCDIDVPSIEWIQKNLNHSFHAIACNEKPGLPFVDGFFTLIYATSVFTHLTEHATGWLLELRRTLADGGLLMLSFLGEGMIHLINEPWDEDRIGFNAIRQGTPWDHGGPLTFISPWWIREHWGRAFEIVELRPYTSPDQEGKPAGHGLALLRKRHGYFSAADIDELAPNEPREIRALQHNLKQLSNEVIQLRQQLAEV
jgi:SAM-dependent methyltransferase